MVYQSVFDADCHVSTAVVYVNGWILNNKDLIQNPTVYADAGLLFSERSSMANTTVWTWYAQPHLDEAYGWGAVLTDLHISFDAIVQEQLTAAELSRYKVVIIPQSLVLSASENTLIEQYVNGGGAIIVTGQSSLRDYNLDINSLNNYRLNTITGVNYGSEPNTKSGTYGSGKYYYIKHYYTASHRTGALASTLCGPGEKYKWDMENKIAPTSITQIRNALDWTLPQPRKVWITGDNVLPAMIGVNSYKGSNFVRVMLNNFDVNGRTGNFPDVLTPKTNVRVSITLPVDLQGQTTYHAYSESPDHAATKLNLTLINTTVTVTIPNLTYFEVITIGTTTIGITPTKIELSANPTTILGDGVSKSTLTARLLDNDNNLVKSATNTIRFSISGIGGSFHSSNQLGNPGFETGAVLPWGIGVPADSTWVIESVEKYKGNYSGRARLNNQASDWITQVIPDWTGVPHNAGEEWTFNVHLKSTTTYSVLVRLPQRTSTAGEIGATQKWYNLTGMEGWVRATVTHTITISSVSLFLPTIQVYSPDKGKDLYIDETELYLSTAAITVGPSRGIAAVILYSTPAAGVATITGTSSGLTSGTTNVTYVFQPTKIQTSANPTTIIADGSSTTVITATITDDTGNIITTATNVVTFAITGQGTWNDGSVAMRFIAPVNGIATIVVRSTTTAGSITVSANATGLTGSNGTVQTTAGTPVRIVGSANPTSIVANGIRESTITASILDAGNNVVEGAANPVTFSIVGQGTWLNGSTTDHTRTPVQGIATIRTRVTTRTGQIKVNANSFGLDGSTNTITTTHGPAYRLEIEIIQGQ